MRSTSPTAVAHCKRLASLDYDLMSSDNAKQFRYYESFVHVFVVVLLVSNLVAQKIVAIGPFRVSAAQALFPITYIFGDIFVEVYGYARSRRAIWIGFFASGLLAVMCLFATWLPAAPEFQNQTAFQAIFGIVPRVLPASLVAYWCGEFANAFVMAKMKLATQGKHLWARTIGSTVVGQLVDTVIVMTILFAGRQDAGTIVNLIVSGYSIKVLYEAAATPLTYLVVNRLKNAEGVEIFDRGTDFNPFRG